MRHVHSACPLSRRELIDTYFIENRTRLLEVAAFLDRLDRNGDASPESDFRMEAFDQALQVLARETPDRVLAIQRIFSDPTTEPREQLDQKSACGAFDSSRLEAR